MDKENLVHLIGLIKECEYRIDEDDIVIWVAFNDIEELTSIFGYSYFEEGNIKVTLKEKSIAFRLSELLIKKGEDYEIIRKELERWDRKTGL